MTPKNIAAFALGPLGAALFGLVTLPVITWFFPAQDIGRIAMLQVALGFGNLLFSLGLDQAYVREYHEAQDRPALLRAALFPGAGLLVVVLLGLLLFQGLIGRLLFGVDSIWLSGLVAIALIAAFLSRFLSLILRMEERGVAYSMAQLLPKVLFLAVIGLYVLLGSPRDLLHLVIANVFSITFVCVLYSWNTRGQWRQALSRRIDRAQLTGMLKFGTPLILGGLAFWGLTATDKIFLRNISTFDQLGVYSVAVSFAGAAMIVQSVFSTVWAPTVYRWVSTGEDLTAVHTVIRYVLIVLLLVFSLAGTFSWLVDFLLPSTYVDVKYILVSCLGYPLMYTLSEATKVGIGIARRSGYSMVASILAFLFNALGNALLIPHFGAAGAAVSTAAAFWLFFVLRTEFSIRLWQPVPRLELYGYTLAVLLLGGATTLYGGNIGYSIHLIWAGVLIATLIRYFSELRAAADWLLTRRSQGEPQ